MRFGTARSLVLIAGLLAAPPAWANPANAQPTSEAAPAEFPAPYQPAWSDEGLARVGEMLAGTWVSEAPVGSGAAAARVALTIAPAPVPGLTDTLLVEAAREDNPAEPFRYAVFRLFRYGEGIRLRTLEIKLGPRSENMLAGFVHATEWFPDILGEDFLIATADVDLAPRGDGYAGSTPHPYPTNLGGAVEMTSALTLTPDRLTTNDTGLNDRGETVWGGEAVAYARSEPLASVTRSDDGLVIVEYANPGESAQERDRLHVRYTGWREDTTLFDSNRDEGDPAFIFRYPPGNQLIPGWTPGTEGVSAGARRKLIIPWRLSYGERGNPRANIAPYAPLFFDIEVLHVERFVEPPAPQDITPDETGSPSRED